jgi:hypothetical protein
MKFKANINPFKAIRQKILICLLAIFALIEMVTMVSWLVLFISQQLQKTKYNFPY